jgi:hypothetical protein
MAHFPSLLHQAHQLFAEIKSYLRINLYVNLLSLTPLNLLHENITPNRREAGRRRFGLVQSGAEGLRVRNALFLNTHLNPALCSWTDCQLGAREIGAADEQTYEK